jgi:Dolichyl-phosphate-mannose-protein mannosyltransferase
MSKQPQNSPPPGRRGAARRDSTSAPYKRPVQSPDAETVMLPSAKAAPDPTDQRERGDALGQDEDEPAASTRVLILPRGKHGSGNARLIESSARRRWVSRAVLAAILCVQAVLSLRMHNTAFEDEALYLYSGHMEIEHWLHGTALQGNYASYFSGAPVLYPVLGAAAESIGGLAVARVVSLLAMLTTTTLLYSLTRILFNERVGLCAAVIFSVTEATIFLGNLATYDASSLCLLALASWIVVRTAPSRWPVYLLAAPVAALAVATKYAALLFVPAIAVLAALASLPYIGRRALLRPLAFAVVMAGLLAAALHFAGFAYLQALEGTTTERAQGSTPALTIVKESLLWGSLPFALAVVGAVAYARRAETEPGEDIAPAGRRYRRISLGVVLAGTALLAPVYQLHLHTDVSLQKHIGFGLFFAAPMAGVGLARIVGDHFRRAQVGIVIWGAALVLGMTQASGLFSGWPNSRLFVQELALYLSPGAHYLVEVDEVPIYYLRGHSDAQPDQFTSTYYIGYVDAQGKFLTGDAGYVAAIKAGYFRVVSYNYQTTPSVDAVLARTLETDPSYRLAAALPNGNDTVTQYVWVDTGRPGG